MTAYELYLVVHVGAVIAWVGSGFLMVVLGTRALLAPDPEHGAAHARDAEWAGLRVFLPSNLIALASAFLLVEEGNWGYDRLWVQLGFVGFGLSFLIGAAYFGPGWARVGKLVAADGPASHAVRTALRRLLAVSWIDLGVLLGVVFVMTVKPTGDEQGALAVTAAIPAAFTLCGLLLLTRRGVAHPPARPLADASYDDVSP